MPLRQVAQPARPVGPVRLARSGAVAEIFAHRGPPPSDLRVRWLSELPGRDALNAFALAVHPMELQRVLPPIAAGEELLLDAIAPGGPLMPEGRPVMLLAPGAAGGQWVLTRPDAEGDAAEATGDREDLVALCLLYANVALGSLADPPPRLPWIPPVRAARDALKRELGDDFEVVRE